MGLVVKLLISGLALCAVAAAAVLWLSGGAVQAREAALAAEARGIETPFGRVEYAERGIGPATLVIHGAGGGFDQALAIAEALGPQGRRWIAPSRFGYLGSDLPEDASIAAQADAFAALLDALEIERVDVLAFSGGVPPALQLAERHPERVSRLILLSSAPFSPFEVAELDRRVPGAVYQSLFLNDAAYWTVSHIAPGLLESAFDARPELRAGLSEAEAAFVDSVVDGFLPASRRRAGVMNEGAAIAPEAVYGLSAITAPALIVHARDDGLNPCATAERLAEGLRRGELVRLDRGGHLLLGHHAALRARINAFLDAPLPPAAPG